MNYYGDQDTDYVRLKVSNNINYEKLQTLLDSLPRENPEEQCDVTYKICK